MLTERVTMSTAAVSVTSANQPISVDTLEQESKYGNDISVTVQLVSLSLENWLNSTTPLISPSSPADADKLKSFYKLIYQLYPAIMNKDSSNQPTIVKQAHVTNNKTSLDNVQLDNVALMPNKIAFKNSTISVKNNEPEGQSQTANKSLALPVVG